MLDIIKSIIVDFQEIPLNTGILRRLKYQTISGKATICIGVRRCGKSTWMFQIMKGLLSKGIPRENILYLNFFDDRLHQLKREGMGQIVEAYYSIWPEKKNSETVYCFFDEIQEVSGWEPFIDRLMRTEKCEVYLTGSSARMLSKEIATQMRGRAFSWELFPFSFREFLDYKQIDSVEPFTTKKMLTIRKAFDEYWETGGFPESLGLDRYLRIKLHQEYFQAVLYRDLVGRHDVSHPKAVKDLAHRLVDNLASLYSINSLTGYLKSLGHKAPKSAVSDYLDWFEDAYFFFTVRLFDPSLARSQANPKKIYCTDHALAASVSSGILINSGHLLENLIFMALRRITPDIYYYKTKSGTEVDFIVRLSTGSSKLLIQVCESLSDPRTRKREISALIEAMNEQGVKLGTIITRNEEDVIDVTGGRIEVIPAWRFLLRIENLM